MRSNLWKLAILLLTLLEDRVSLPAYYLWGHSLELSLKAFLLGRGVPIETLKSRNFGHDLKALLKEARKHRLGTEVPLDQKEIGVISLLSHDYAAKRFEYRETGTYHLPYDFLTRRVAEKFVQLLKPYCQRVTVGKKNLTSRSRRTS